MIAYRLWGDVTHWSGVMFAGCTAGPTAVFAGAGNGWPHGALWYY